MGGYYEPSQIFLPLYGIVALAYFVVNFAISSYSLLSKQWEQLVNKNKNSPTVVFCFSHIYVKIMINYLVKPNVFLTVSFSWLKVKFL